MNLNFLTRIFRRRFTEIKPTNKPILESSVTPTVSVGQMNRWIYLIIPVGNCWFVETISCTGEYRYISEKCSTLEEASNTARQFCQIHKGGMITRGFPGYGFMPRIY